MKVPRKYGFLRFIAFVLKLLAWLILVAGIIGLIAGLAIGLSDGSGGWPLPRWQLLWGAGTIAALVSVIWFVQLFAAGSILSLLVDIEENTRALAAHPPASSSDS